MKRIILVLISALTTSLCFAHTDTLKISSAYTTHLIFSSDIVYADLSSPADVVAKIIEQNRNLLAVKARAPFEDSTSISALESNGTMHTFIVSYDPYPKQLVIDMRANHAVTQESTRREVGRGSKAEWPFLSPGDFPDPVIEPRSPALQADSLPSEPPGKLIMKCLSSVPFSRSVVFDFLQPHGPQHARPPCPSPPTPSVYPNSCPLS